jgi:hypothetical protein
MSQIPLDAVAVKCKEKINHQGHEDRKEEMQEKKGILSRIVA